MIHDNNDKNSSSYLLSVHSVLRTLLSLFNFIVTTVYCSFTNDRNMLKEINQLSQSNITNKYSDDV